MHRRDLLKATAALPPLPPALTALAGTAQAQQAWPGRNITMIVPFPAGGQAAYMDAPEFAKFVIDGSARLIAAVKKIGRVE